MKTIINLMICLSLGFLQAQSLERQVIGSSGTTINNSDVTLDFTVGELAVTTITNGTTLTQGFHQGVIALSVSAEVLVYLQGASFSPVTGEEDLMRDDLRSNGLIPTMSPYAEDVVTTTSAVFTVTGNNAIVDWVLVQLRDETDASVVIASKSGLLQRDGDIVGVDGVTPLEFDERSGDFYVSVNHRNHLGIISSQPISLSSTGANKVDFTATEMIVEGGALSVVLLSNGKYAIFTGDNDDNGQVQSTDLNGVIGLLGNAGYNSADMDMNGQIQTIDINSLLIPNIGRGSQLD